MISKKFPNGIDSFRSLFIDSSSNASKYLLITKENLLYTRIFVFFQQNL